MQKGFATLEIIFAVLIIGILLTAAVPNAARVVDRAALDYETKRLYGDLRFLQSASRSGEMDLLGTGRDDLQPEKLPYMQINPARRSWQILRGTNPVPVREEHFMRNGIKISSAKDKIRFDTSGSPNISTSITLTPRFGKANAIVFDSVGRFRGGRSDD